MCESDAHRFASCMNGGEFRGASRFLDDHCVCYRGDRVLSGKDEILDWYREHWQEGRSDVFDLLAFPSVQRLADREFGIVYCDAIRHRGKPMVYKRRQKIVFNRFGRIDLIIDRELPEEQEKLDRFTEAAGLD